MWWVYLLECADGSYYCGCTNNLEKRLRTHNSGKGSRYTRSRLPVKLVCSRAVSDKSEALRLEYRVKQLPRERKESFLRGVLE